MGAGCPLLNSYSMPAERLRGCVFAEGFRSFGDVARNALSIQGPPTVADGYAMFNGATTSVTYDYQVFPTNFTVSCWLRADALQNARIVTSQAAGADSVNGLGVGVTAGGNIFTVYGDGGTAGYSAVFATAYANGAWHHVVFSADRVNNLHYVTIDGVVVANGVGGAATVGSIGTATQLGIGGRPSGGGAWFAGSIRDVKLWQEVLTTQEAQQLYAQNVYSYYRRMRCFLPMGSLQHDPVNTRTLDVTGNGFHGVFGAGAAAPVKIPGPRGYQFVASGAKVGGIYGAGDYMTVGALNAAAPWTVAFATGNQEAGTFSYPVGFATGAGAQPGVFNRGDIAFGGSLDWGSYNGVGAFNDTMLKAEGAKDLEHMAFTLTAAPLWVMYRNGRQIVTSGNAAVGLPAVQLGRRGDNPAGNVFYSGEMYYFAAWNESLSPLQVADFFARMNMEDSDV